jgi:hypothetical protein
MRSVTLTAKHKRWGVEVIDSCFGLVGWTRRLQCAYPDIVL